MEVSYLGSPLLYVHTHHIQDNVHSGNDMQCGLTLGTENIKSPLLDITLNVDEGNRVAVNCCVAWSFPTSLMASARVWSPFS